MNTLLKGLVLVGGLVVALPSVAAELKPVTLSEFVAKVKAEQAEKETQGKLLAQDLTVKPAVTADVILETAPAAVTFEAPAEPTEAQATEEAATPEQPVVTAEPEAAEPVQAQTTTTEVKQS